MLALADATYGARRAVLVATAVPGTAAARALSDLTDEAVAALAGTASRVGAPFAIFALGGYGARRLLPRSDVDLLLVTTASPAGTAALVRAVVYPLWDEGLSVGHQVRSPRDQAHAMAEDLETLTSFLTARLVTGDEALAAETVARAFKQVARTSRATLKALAGRERPGSPYLLEPDLKCGAGGQRDIDELVWHAVIAGGEPRGTCERGLAEQLAEAQDALTAARWELHRSLPRTTNALSVEATEALGIDAERTQRALATVNEALLEARGAASLPAPPVTADALVALAACAGGIEALERLAWAGALDAVAPGFRDLMTLRRPALSHRYTVGAHSLRAVVTVGSADAFRTLDPPVRRALAVAALAHDLGKREPAPGHAGRGADEVSAIAARLGLAPEEATDAATLVREHLLLTQTAMTRDLNDEDLVLAAAARLGKQELVAALFQLTAADMKATGPDAWTPWRATLIAELARKMEAAFAPEIDGAGIVAAAEATRRKAIRSASRTGAPRSVLGFLESAPLPYLARRTPEAVLADARLVQHLAGPGLPGEVALAVRQGPFDGSWNLEVVTRDRPGLFAVITGTLALVGLDALAAEAFTARSGIALDTFTVTSATRAAVEPSTWNAFERTLRSALRDPASLEVRLAERRTHYDRTGDDPRIAPQVAVTHHGPFTTGVRIRAQDRVGLLHDVARAIEHAGFDIRRAIIATASGIADDAFELVDASGDPPDPQIVAERLGHLADDMPNST